MGRQDDARRLAELGLNNAADVLDAIADAADPSLALSGLERLIQASPAGESGQRARLLHELAASAELRRRLPAVLGASAALGEHLVESAGGASGGEPSWSALASDPGSVELDRSGVSELRRSYRRELLRIAAGDLVGNVDLVDTTVELSALADRTLRAALAMVGKPGVDLDVLAMGKCGARELNYVSDVDVLFVTSDAGHGAEATVCARRLMQVCREVAWQVDAGLRPEGQHGPLVRSLDSYLAYYQRWADSWEFQALLKARWVTGLSGSVDTANAWEQQIAPMVWTAVSRPQFVADVQAMRRRVERHVGVGGEHDIKLGPGGLRDIEFAVQLLQLVHGQADPTLQMPGTFTALAALTAGGYVGRPDGSALRESYRFLRLVEHRLQLRSLRRTHRLPSDPGQLRPLARSLGHHRSGAAGGDSVENFLADWRHHRMQVRQLHEKLFYRPLLSAVARLPADAVRLTPDAAHRRLAVLGFADPSGALRHVSALTSGVSRRAAIQRSLLPVMLAEFANGPDPDAGLLAYRRVSEQLGKSPWFLRLMRDGDALALRVARVLGRSRYIANLLERDAQGLSLLADDADLKPRPADVLRELFVTVARRAAAEPGTDSDRDNAALRRAVGAVRGRRRHELLRVASADVCGLLSTEEVGRALSDVGDATIAGTLEVVRDHVAAKYGGELPTELAVIAMGRLGGQEMSYASDSDVLFVHRPRPGSDPAEASAAATAVASRCAQLLAEPGPDPAVMVDAKLRPEGKGGPLVPSLSAYRRYYQGRSALWEAQALLRARPAAGDVALGAAFNDLIAEVRYRPEGLSPQQLRELRRMKARVETERLPRGADPTTHLKFGRGALVDVEWAVQLLQLQHCHAHPELRTPGTLAALAAAGEMGFLSPADQATLSASWTLVSHVRGCVALVRGSGGDQLPRVGRELLGVAQLVSGGSAEEIGEFMDGYLRVTRRARKVVERLLTGGFSAADTTATGVE